mmetsp:Transcript_35475/g.94407  ORF Transcript_35475/g.94407 Transcript_35475/m.94407 type:complete len:203 (+) Transcript_35475:1420-2028(+)
MSLQSSKTSSCFPGIKTASNMNCCPATSSAMFVICRVMLTSPWWISLLLNGRTRQKTRIEPFKSSMALCSLRRRPSASRRSVSGIPASFASLTTSPIRALMLRKASMLPMFTLLESSIADFISSNARSFRSSSSKMMLASWYSTGPRPTSLALAMAKRSSGIVAFSTASARMFRASCFGSSILNTSSAFATSEASTPASRPC